MKILLLRIAVFTALFAVFVQGCSNVKPEGTGIDITGTLTLPSPAPGKPYAVIFDADRNPFNGYSQKAAGTCGAGALVSYSLTVSAANNYYIYALVDNDGNSAQAYMQYAGPGDFFGVYGAAAPEWPVSPNAAVNKTAGQYFNITMTAAAANVSGNLSLEYAETSAYYVIIDTDTKYENGFISIATGSCGGLSSVPYGVYAVFPGTYYAYAVVDTDNDSEINYDPGDELGYHNGPLPLEPPALPGIAIDGTGGSVPADITLLRNNYNFNVILRLPADAAGKDYSVWRGDSFNITPATRTTTAFSGVCGSGTEIFLSSNEAPADSYIYAYVDVSATGSPNAGDYIGVYGALYPELPAAKSGANGLFIIDMVQVSDNVVGDISGVGNISPGTPAYVIVISDFDDPQSLSGYYRSTCSGNFSYSLFIPFPGLYIFGAVVDVSGTGQADSPGNYAGFAGSTVLPYIPVTEPNISINIKAINRVDIPVAEIP